jgi:hypothetical protein
VLDAQPAKVMIYTMRPGVTAPELLPVTQAPIPDEKCKKKIKSAIQISLYVDADGVPLNLAILSPKDPKLDEFALNTVAGDRFKPGTYHGISRRVWRASAPSQLPPLLRRPEHLADRHLDDARRHQLWLVYRLTGSALLLGTVSFAGQIPTFLFAPFAGVWVDRLDRRQVLVWTQTLSMVQSLALAALTLSGHITIPVLLILSVMQGIVNAFDMPGRQSFMVRWSRTARPRNAIAINSSMVNMARLIGPSLAGMLIAVTSEGWCFLIDGISYIAVIASLLDAAHTPVVSAKPPPRGPS